MSRATFVRHFTYRTGTPVASLVTAIRMMIAADLLARDDRQIGAIATAVGYRSESAFGRAFRVAMGTTPARFRKLAHGKAPSVTGSIAG
jgi:AraC family transcriptional activator of mtrCDE